MPEHAEVRLMTEFANRVLDTRFVVKIEQNPISKVKFNLPEDISYPFKIKSISRGKEARLNMLYPIKGGKKGLYILINFGMSGSWNHSVFQWQKHAMLSFTLDDGTFLEFVDARRFGSFKVLPSGMFWGPMRGPDPVGEFSAFRQNIISNNDASSFKKPLCEMMLDQTYFNGVGNYLRSTILQSADINPFQTGWDTTIDEFFRICDMTRFWCNRAYELGGAELYTWKNPDSSAPKLSDVIYYKKGLSCRDNTWRTFWFDPKWKSNCPYPLINNKKI